MNSEKLVLRPMDAAADYQRVADIYNDSFWAPITVATLEDIDREFPAAGYRHRVVGTDGTDRVVAFGTLIRDGYEPPGQYTVRVVVDAPFRHQGFGSRILSELEQTAFVRGATRLDAKFRDDDSFLAFAEHRGYAVHTRQYGWTLDIPAFDEGPFVHVLTRLTDEGLHFVSLADGAAAPAPHALYDLERHANHDEPGFENEPFLPYDQWYAETYESENRPLDCTIAAMDGARPVAMAAIRKTADGNMGTSFTGVHRDYRGRGLAQAVKLLAIRAARRHGARLLLTGNSDRNHALLHVNAKLGFARTPGMYWCIKHLTDAR